MEHGIAGRHAGISAGASHQTGELRPVSRPATKGWGAGARAGAGRSGQRPFALRQAAKSTLRLLLGRRIEAEDRAAFMTSSVTKSSNAVISTASAAISSARCAGITTTPSPSPTTTSPGHTGDVAAADRHVDVERLMQGQVGRRGRAVVVGGNGEPRDLRRVAKAAVGHDAGDAALHQPRDQDRAGRGGARVLAAVDHEHGARAGTPRPPCAADGRDPGTR